MRLKQAISALALLMVGCSQPLTPDEILAGAYELLSIDGQPVPFLLTTSPQVEILSRRLVLDEHGRFVDQIELRVEVDGAAQLLPTQKTGAYFADGTSVTLAYTSGRRVDSVLRDGIIELADNGLLFRLER